MSLALAELYKANNWKVPMDDLLPHYGRDFLVQRHLPITDDDMRLAIQESGISDEEMLTMREKALIVDKETADRGLVLDFAVQQKPQPQQPTGGWQSHDPLTVLAVTSEKTLQHVTRAALAALAEAHARTVCRAVIATKQDKHSGQAFADISYAVSVHRKISRTGGAKVQWRSARDEHYDELVPKVFDAAYSTFVLKFAPMIPAPQPILARRTVQNRQMQTEPLIATLAR